MATSQWREVSRAEPCPICGKPDWCRMNDTWIVCRRVDNGQGIHRIDKAGADYWLYRRDGTVGPVAVDSLPDIQQIEPERADDKTLYMVYTSLLRMLTLSDAHRANLRRRGLSDEEISKRRYRTLPVQSRSRIAKRLLDKYSAETLLKVPGFYIKEEDGRRWLTLAGTPGILIPVRNTKGEIIGLKIRADDPGNGPKYTWLSSSYHDGPGPSNRVHVPVFTGETAEIRITEGELKADIATALTGILTVSIPGVSSWRQALPILEEYGAKTVKLAFDADAVENLNVARALGLTTNALLDKGYNLELETWDIKDGKGIDDLLAAGKKPRLLKGEDAIKEVGRIIRTARENDPRHIPEIMANRQDLHLVTEETIKALKKANSRNPYMFLRGGPVRIERGDSGHAVTRELTPDRLRYELARIVRWYKLSRDGEREDAKPPMDVVRNILAAPNLPFPALASIVRAPTFAPDGTLELETGYREKSRSYYDPYNAVELPRVPENPGQDDIRRAKDLILKDLLVDFPFASDSDRAHAVALLLLPFVRNMIQGPTPLHLIEASTQGSGKGLLANVLLYPALGAPVGVMPPPRDDEELRKNITSRLCEGWSAILIDNVYSLRSAILAAALTAETWTDRMLGRNETVSIPIRWAWVATGNNAVVSTDIARRSIRIRLTPSVENPWLRDNFKHPDLRDWVATNRGDLVWAALVLVQSWVAAGMPESNTVPLGSFESWSKVMAGILDHVGIPGFLGNIMEFYELADSENVAWREFVLAWWDAYRDKPVKTGSELFEIAQKVEGIWFGNATTERGQKTVFGHQVAQRKDRVYGGYRITFAGTHQGASTWRLVPVGELPDREFTESSPENWDKEVEDYEPF